MSFSSIVKCLVLILYAIITTTSSTYGTSTGLPPTSAPDDSLLKDVTPAELQQVIDSYRGDKAVLVNIWATWCA